MRMLVEPLFQPFSLPLTRGFQPFGRTSAIQSLTNAQKLSLPANTPVGTEVMVSDWVAAGLAGPHQRLNVPSTAQGGVFVLGGTQNGVYAKADTQQQGKDWFYLLGNSSDPGNPNALFWTEAVESTVDDAGGSATGPGFVMVAGDETIAAYYSLSDVATPDLATNWKNASDDSPASITVTSVTRGELDAGVTVAGAGTGAANGSYDKRGESGSKHWGFYNKVGQPTTDPDDTPPISCIAKDEDSWIINSSTVGTQWYFTSVDPDPYFFPWEEPEYLVQPPNGISPAPTVTRNDVASEANWEVI